MFLRGALAVTPPCWQFAPPFSWPGRGSFGGVGKLVETPTQEDTQPVGQPGHHDDPGEDA